MYDVLYMYAHIHVGMKLRHRCHSETDQTCHTTGFQAIFRNAWHMVFKVEKPGFSCSFSCARKANKYCTCTLIKTAPVDGECQYYSTVSFSSQYLVKKCCLSGFLLRILYRLCFRRQLNCNSKQSKANCNLRQIGIFTLRNEHNRTNSSN